MHECLKHKAQVRETLTEAHMTNCLRFCNDLSFGTGSTARTDECGTAASCVSDSVVFVSCKQCNNK